MTSDGARRMAEHYARRAEGAGEAKVRPVLQRLGKQIVESYQRTIEGMTPGRFRDLAESTKRQKARDVGHVYPMLAATLAMVSSLYSRVERRAGAWFVRVSFAGRHPGSKLTNKQLAQLHVEGGPHLPARDFTRVPNRIFNQAREELRRLALGRK